MTNMDNDKLCPSSEQITNAGRRQNGCQSEACKGYGSMGCTCRIRELNDRLRTTMSGGLVHMTDGIAVLGLSTVNAIFKAISTFTDFTPDNDPWGEHDCAVMEVGGHRIIWKIDYYDRHRTYHSPDAADPKVTVRVLTIMLSQEY
ncbi:DUF3768 domain-containing protein [Aestuariivirga sp.]|uniref:DUF3768 domain-containing protein n=1 Tax=Aestuariivirga sp. TaxID=2650926 RepID=UPI0035931633